MKVKLTLILIIVLGSLLRLYSISSNPVSLFGDEADVGYQAYSILKTGKDYYGNPWPIHFHSLAEWRTPLYLYSVVPTVSLFGITPLGVRLPAAIFGIATIPLIFLLAKRLFDVKNNEKIALLSAFLLSISPWHVQYSRAAFEVTLLLLLFVGGLVSFLYSEKKKYLLPISVGLFCLTPWVYSTAKVFTPFFIVMLLLLWNKKLLSYGKKYITLSIVVGILIGGPIAVNTIIGGGTERFSYISVFTDPTLEPSVGTSRTTDAHVRGDLRVGLNPTVLDRLTHNKVTYFARVISDNYLKSFSTDFLFIEGDPNLRHSAKGVGQFYKPEIITIFLGLLFVFAKSKNNTTKTILGGWILLGVIPSSLTRDGGNHATRLILILIPLVIISATGFIEIVNLPKKKALKVTLLSAFSLVFLVSFLSFMHTYFVHSMFESERWWHAGLNESVKKIKEIDSQYDKVIITTANEPPWIFFAAFYEYNPENWQKEFPISHKVFLDNFGEVSYINKFYFASPNGGRGLYEWGQILDKKTLYLASEKEVKVNLILEPERLPGNLNLVHTVKYPSGEPAYYLFSGK